MSVDGLGRSLTLLLAIRRVLVHNIVHPVRRGNNNSFLIKELESDPRTRFPLQIKIYRVQQKSVNR